MLMFRVRGERVEELLTLLETAGWEGVLRLGSRPSGAGRLQVLLAEKFYLRNNSTMGLAITAECAVGDELTVTIVALGGKASVLRLKLGADNELEEEAATRIKKLARERKWQVSAVTNYSHHD